MYACTTHGVCVCLCDERHRASERFYMMTIHLRPQFTCKYLLKEYKRETEQSTVCGILNAINLNIRRTHTRTLHAHTDSQYVD